MHFTDEGFPHSCADEVKDFKKWQDSFATDNGCVFYGVKVVVLAVLRENVFE